MHGPAKVKFLQVNSKHSTHMATQDIIFSLSKEQHVVRKKYG